MTKYLNLLAALLIICPIISKGADGGGLLSELQAYHDLASTVDGDTYTLSNGTHSGTGGIVITKKITIAGSGWDNVTIEDDRTENGPIIELDTTIGTGMYRVTGFEIIPGLHAETDGSFNSGTIRVLGASSNVRIDNVRFWKTSGHLMRTNGAWIGVIDHCHFENGQNTGNAIQFWHSQWGGDSWGDGSWTSPMSMVNDQEAIYIEDCTFNNDTGSKGVACDAYSGARYVFRHNTFRNYNLPTHGTGDGSGRNRGPRRIEVYSNDITYDPPDSKNTFHIRGATGVYFNNTHTGVSKSVTINYYRAGARPTGPWGSMNGLNGWDNNSNQDDASTPGGAGDGVFWSGTATAGSSGLILEDTNQNWTVGELEGYTIWVASAPQLTRGYFHSTVISNTATTAEVGGAVQGESANFQPGDQYEVRLIPIGLDMPGAGQSGPMHDKSTTPQFTGDSGNSTSGSGSTLTDSSKNWTPDEWINHRLRIGQTDYKIIDNTDTTLTVEESASFAGVVSYQILFWQELMPWAFWNNTPSGLGQTGTKHNMYENVHYFTDEGLGGVSKGTLAQRPGSGTIENEMYWATDTSILYKWSGSAWEDYWQEYTYPHPLISGELPPVIPPAPPTVSLRFINGGFILGK